MTDLEIQILRAVILTDKVLKTSFTSSWSIGEIYRSGCHLFGPHWNPGISASSKNLSVHPSLSMTLGRLVKYGLIEKCDPHKNRYFWKPTSSGHQFVEQFELVENQGKSL